MDFGFNQLKNLVNKQVFKRDSPKNGWDLDEDEAFAEETQPQPVLASLQQVFDMRRLLELERIEANDKLRQQKEEAQRQIQEQREEIQRAREELRKQQEQVKVEQEYYAKLFKFTQVVGEEDTHAQMIEKLTNENLKLDQEIQDIGEMQMKLNEEYEDRIESMQRELATLGALCGNQQSAYQEFRQSVKGKLKGVLRQVHAYDQQVGELSRELARSGDLFRRGLEQALQEAERQSEKSEEARKQEARVAREAEELRRQNAGLGREVEELKQDLEYTTKVLKQVRQSEDQLIEEFNNQELQIAELMKKLEDSQQNVKILEQRLYESQNKQQRFEEQQDLEEQMGRIRDENIELKGEIQAKEQVIEELRHQLNIQKTDPWKQEDDPWNINESSHSKIDELEFQLSQQKQNYESQINELRSTIQGYEKQLRMQSSKEEVQSEQIQQLQKCLVDSEYTGNLEKNILQEKIEQLEEVLQFGKNKMDEEEKVSGQRNQEMAVERLRQIEYEHFEEFVDDGAWQLEESIDVEEQNLPSQQFQPAVYQDFIPYQGGATEEEDQSQLEEENSQHDKLEQDEERQQLLKCQDDEDSADENQDSWCNNWHPNQPPLNQTIQNHSPSDVAPKQEAHQPQDLDIAPAWTFAQRPSEEPDLRVKLEDDDPPPSNSADIPIKLQRQFELEEDSCAIKVKQEEPYPCDMENEDDSSSPPEGEAEEFQIESNVTEGGSGSQNSECIRLLVADQNREFVQDQLLDPQCIIKEEDLEIEQENCNFDSSPESSQPLQEEENPDQQAAQELSGQDSAPEANGRSSREHQQPSNRHAEDELENESQEEHEYDDISRAQDCSMSDARVQPESQQKDMQSQSEAYPVEENSGSNFTPFDGPHQATQFQAEPFKGYSTIQQQGEQRESIPHESQQGFAEWQPNQDDGFQENSNLKREERSDLSQSQLEQLRFSRDTNVIRQFSQHSQNSIFKKFDSKESQDYLNSVGSVRSESRILTRFDSKNISQLIDSESQESQNNSNLVQIILKQQNSNFSHSQNSQAHEHPLENSQSIIFEAQERQEIESGISQLESANLQPCMSPSGQENKQMEQQQQEQWHKQSQQDDQKIPKSNLPLDAIEELDPWAEGNQNVEGSETSQNAGKKPDQVIQLKVLEPPMETQEQDELQESSARENGWDLEDDLE